MRPVKDQSRGKIASRSYDRATGLGDWEQQFNKISFRELFEHFHEPGSAEDGSSRCIHVFKSFWVLSRLNWIKIQK